MSLRFVFAALILALLVAVVGWQDVWNALSRLTLLSLLQLVVLSVVLIWISSVKWQLFIKAAGHRASITDLMRLYTVGYFINSFLPSFVGGDVVRSLHLGEQISDRSFAFVSTFLERFTGLLAMTTLGLIFVFAGAPQTKGLELAVSIVGFGVLAAAVLLFSERGNRLVVAIVERLLVFLPERFHVRGLDVLKKAEAAFAVGRAKPRLLALALMWSFIYHCFAVVNTYVAAQAVGWESPDISALFIVVPLVLIIGMIPLTPNGLGIQEGAFLYFLKHIGATEGQALGVGVVLRAKTLILAIIGGILWSSLKRKP